MTNSKTLKIIFLGDVDCGKSTLIGRLMLETHSLPADKLKDAQKIAKELGQDACLAFLVDQLKEERENLQTIDTTQVHIKNHGQHFVLIDAPGHVEFLKNMMTGATQADCAVLLIDATQGVTEQSRRHIILANILGIKNLVVAVNKMDLVSYRKEIFEEIRNELFALLSSLSLVEFFVIPICAIESTNISRTSTLMPWYRGLCLLSAMGKISMKKKSINPPLRIPVQDVYSLGKENIVVGTVASGKIKQSQDILILPSKQKAKIDSIRIFNRRKTSARDKESIGFTLKPFLNLTRGNIICDSKNVPSPANRFTAKIFAMSSQNLKTGEEYTIQCATQETQGSIERIENRMDSSTLTIKENNSQAVGMYEIANVVIKTSSPLVVEKFDFIQELGRLTVAQGHRILAAGVVTEVVPFT